jgi:hypothetical protein
MHQLLQYEFPNEGQLLLQLEAHCDADVPKFQVHANEAWLTIVIINIINVFFILIPFLNGAHCLI